MRWRLGYHGVATTRGFPRQAFGHFGFGGSGAWADPQRHLSVALIVNSGLGSPFGDLRTARIGGAALACANARSKPAGLLQESAVHWRRAEARAGTAIAAQKRGCSRSARRTYTGAFLASSDAMTSKPYLNPAVLDAIDPAQFQAQQPFPWINPQYFIRPDRYRRIAGKHA